jgi:AraC family transcriptional regulator
VKDETRDFYGNAVRRAIERIVRELDVALDLEAIAKTAALSPFHFHRVFRGMVGETPLELHRRLRMERAADRLLRTDESVTQIAFGAGYDTHEAFTRAFRTFYGVSPSAFRKDVAEGCRPRQFELPARSNIHFSSAVVVLPQPEVSMKVDIVNMPNIRLATVRHVGPYDRISEAFARLGEIAGRAGLFQYPEAKMLAVYHDDPETTERAALRSDAGISLPDDAELPAGLGELRLAAGRYAKTTHEGPYNTLGDTWSRLMGVWLPSSGERVGAGLSYEIYRNTPMNAAPHELRTDLYVPLA